ncbi:MAG: hypothetical protein LBU70_08750 [Chitinispirillales bacterium]|jgi:hypothetical protein|nr:hypothetical protein [Chitinispirillales bacterium]
MYVKKTVIAAILICAVAQFAFAGGDSGGGGGGWDETRFRMGGYLETGIDVHHRVNRDETETRAIARGEIEISARPARGVRAEIGIEYSHRDTFMTIDKFYAQYSLPGNGMVRAGVMKKTFGLEERAGLTERYFHRRSIINSELKDLGFLAHDLTLMYRHDLNDNWRFTGGVAWAMEDSLRYLQNYSARYNMTENMMFILAAIIRHYNIPESVTEVFHVEGISTTFATSASFRYESEKWVSESEVTLGTNPRIKIREMNRNAAILGIRQQGYFPINVNTKTLRQIIPIAEAALYWDDLTSGNFDTQIRGGLAFGFTNNSALQFRNTYGMILRTQDGDTTIRRHRFDSEVVVIF